MHPSGRPATQESPVGSQRSVCDLDRIEIRANFTGLSPVLTTITLENLAADDPSEALQTLRDAFTAQEELRPRLKPAQITEQAAAWPSV